MPLELDLSALPNCKGSFTPRSIALSLFFALFVSSLRTAFNQWIPKSLAEDRLYKGASAGPWPEPTGCCLRGILCGSQWCSQGGWVYGEVGVWVNWAEDEPPATQHPRGSLSAAVPGCCFYTAIYVSSPGPSASPPTSQGTERSVGALLPFISERECSSPLCVTNWQIRKPRCQTFVLKRAAPCTLPPCANRTGQWPGLLLHPSDMLMVI